MKNDSIKTLVISDAPISNVKGIWCFNYLSKNVKLGSIQPKVLMSEQKRINLIMNYLRKYALIYMYSPKWDVIISTSFLDGLGLSVFQLFGFRRGVKHIIIDQAALSANAMLHPILPILMHHVSKIICFTTAQDTWWKKRLESNKSVFIPYAISDRAKGLETKEKDYVVSGGGSSRDYATLVRAVSGMEVPVVICAFRDPVTRKTSLEGIPVPSNVSVHPMLPHDQFFKLIRESKIVVIPLKDGPRAGGQSVLLESFAAGKPVIATGTAGMKDYIEDGKTGILVKPNNPKELKLAISSLLENENLRKYLGRNARKAFETTYNLQEIGRRMSKIIKETL